MGYNFLRTKDLLQKVKNHKIWTFSMLLPRRDQEERNNEILSENLILNFSNYSPAPDLLESLNREKVIKNCDESDAKGLRSVALGRSSLGGMLYFYCYILTKKI